jgi:hypothetical protein
MRSPSVSVALTRIRTPTFSTTCDTDNPAAITADTATPQLSHAQLPHLGSVNDQPKHCQASHEDKMSSVNRVIQERVGRAGLEPATYGLAPRRSQWLPINPVFVCPPTDYVAHYILMVAINFRWLSTMNDE